MVSAHPSKVLTEAFRRKPYQGPIPESADFVFIGLDANYSPDIEVSETFPQVLPQVLEYHNP